MAVSDCPESVTVTGTSSKSVMADALGGPIFTSNCGPQAYRFLRQCSARFSRKSGSEVGGAERSCGVGAGFQPLIVRWSSVKPVQGIGSGRRFVFGARRNSSHGVNFWTIGNGRPKPKALDVIFSPGGAWRRLYSFWSTLRAMERTKSGS